MKYRTTLLSLAAGAALALSATAVVSQDDKDMQAAMAAMARWMNPTDVHEAMEPLVGDFDLSWRFRMLPGGPWQEGTSEATRKWILGGRFIEEISTSDYGGMEYEGRGLYGYDAYANEYTTVFCDSLGTTSMMGRGERKEGEPMTTEGTYSDPMTENKHRWYRTVWRIVDKDTNVHEVHSKDADGTEFLSLEITFKRK